jgi:hypothetical protein
MTLRREPHPPILLRASIALGGERLGRGLPGILAESPHERPKSAWQVRIGLLEQGPFIDQELSAQVMQRPRPSRLLLLSLLID